MGKATLTVAATLALGLGAVAQAALPPNYQRQRELQEVLNEAVPILHDPVDQITWVGTDRYRVLAGRCIVIARIVTMPSVPLMSGPRKFRVVLGAKTCR